MSCLTLTLSALAIAGSHMLSDPPAQPIEPDAPVSSIFSKNSNRAACAHTSSAARSHSPLITLRTYDTKHGFKIFFNSNI